MFRADVVVLMVRFIPPLKSVGCSGTSVLKMGTRERIMERKDGSMEPKVGSKERKVGSMRTKELFFIKEGAGADVSEQASEEEKRKR